MDKQNVIEDNIPNETKALPQWCVWKWVDRDGKRTKPPFQVDGSFAESDDPKTWTTYPAAIQASKNNEKWDGPGFFLTDEYTGIDWDDCVSPDGTIDPAILQQIKEIDSYTEISPSGTGLKTLVRGKLPAGGHHNKTLGVFNRTRYFAMTGRVLDCVSKNIEFRQDQLDALVRRHWPQDFKPKQIPTDTRLPLSLSDAELIEKARSANDGGKFSRLWDGYTTDYPSPSEADQALCCKLAFWVGKDPARIDSLFRQSGLMREKWDRADYRERTIARAIELTSEIYDPQRACQPQPATNAPNPSSPEQTRHYHLTDTGNGERFADNHRENVRFCFPANRWSVWDKRRWKQDNEGVIMQLAKRTTRAIYHEARKEPDPEKSQKIGKWAAASESSLRQMAMIKMAQSEPGIPILPEQMDAYPMLLNVKNGILDLSKGVLLPHDKKLLLTKLVDVNFNPDALCPRWLEFLEMVTDGDPAMVDYLCRVAGYTLTGQTGEQCFFLLWGTGQNGKSTFLNVLQTILADYALQTDFNTFVVKKNDSIRNDIARLKNTRMVTAIESGDGNRLDEQVVKQLTGTDKVTARFLHQEFFDYRPEYKIFLAANQKPTIYGQDVAIWRRVRLIPFTVKIPDENRIQDYEKVLLEEAEGILNWMVFGCLEWQKMGKLGHPEAVEMATKDYRSEMDVLEDFLNNRCVFGAVYRVTHAELYESQ